jgi:predicted nucleic acid-binding protein
LAAYFFDTSALAKFYHPEVGTPAVDRIVQHPSSKIRVSRLTVVEIPSVFAIKVRTGIIGREDAGLLLRQFQEDVVSGKFEVFSVGDAQFSLAEILIGKYAFDQRLRTLDALQMAVALELRDQTLMDHFVSADKVLCQIGVLEGLAVLNPEDSDLPSS